MPRVDIDFTKGLVQLSGGGFAVNALAEVSATATLDATTFLTKAVAAFTNNNELTLPSSADTGTVKIIISDSANNVVLKGTNAQVGDTTLTNIGDMAICVFDGTEWQVGRSLT